MKIINKEDLVLLIPLITDRNCYSLATFELLLDRFGDDYFIEDGEFIKTKENEEMARIRERFSIGYSDEGLN